jgi:hypothetical protein
VGNRGGPEERKGNWGAGERRRTEGDKKERETGGSHNELVGIKLKFEGR